MPVTRRHLALLVCAAAVLATIAAASAFAAVVRINSHISISGRHPAFHGRVKSDNNACERRRRVKLFRQRRGDDKLLGKDLTNHEGQWEIEVEPLRSGAYYAKVKRREEGAAGTTFICRGDRSKTVVVD